MNIRLLDQINAFVEFTCFVPNLLNLFQLLKDRQVKGYNIWTMPYWVLFGIWFLFFYDYMHLTLSFWATFLWCLMYSAYSVLSFYFKFKPGLAGN